MGQTIICKKKKCKSCLPIAVHRLSSSRNPMEEYQTKLDQHLPNHPHIQRDSANSHGMCGKGKEEATGLVFGCHGNSVATSGGKATCSLH